MKFHYLLISLVILSCGPKDIYDPNQYLSTKEQQNIIRKTIRYSAKLAPQANQQNKHDKEFDWYYEKAIKECTLKAFYVDASGLNYFLITRVARSITPMFEGIGGRIKVDDSGKLMEYEEIFRTWKMSEDTLAKRARFLFERMVQGKDLTMYYSKFQEDRYIEFPDDRFFFDVKEWRWRDNELDSLKLN